MTKTKWQLEERLLITRREAETDRQIETETDRDRDSFMQDRKFF